MIENVTSHPIPTTKLNKKTIVAKSPPTSKISVPSSPTLFFPPILPPHSLHLILSTHSSTSLFTIAGTIRSTCKTLAGRGLFFWSLKDFPRSDKEIPSSKKITPTRYHRVECRQNRVEYRQNSILNCVRLRQICIQTRKATLLSPS